NDLSTPGILPLYSGEMNMNFVVETSTSFSNCWMAWFRSLTSRFSRVTRAEGIFFSCSNSWYCSAIRIVLLLVLLVPEIMVYILLILQQNCRRRYSLLLFVNKPDLLL